MTNAQAALIAAVIEQAAQPATARDSIGALYTKNLALLESEV
jgi:hypothetical protein